MVKKKACIFISGSGTNLRSIIKNTRDYNFPIDIKLIISNKKNAKGIIYAKKYSIPYRIISNREQEFEQSALKYINSKKIELICLAGFMKILSKNFIRNYKGKILNIHPSLLPKYKGLNTHDRALKNKEKFSGCTVHFVTPKLDSGKIIMQKKVSIKKNDSPKKLGKRILKQEHILYAKAIMKLFSSP